MKLLKYSSLLLVSVLAYACQTDEIPTFTGKNSVYFQKYFIDEFFPGTALKDSTETSFYFTKENEMFIDVKLRVLLSGKALQEDLKFKLKVVDDQTTLKPDEYELQDYYTFRKKAATTTEKVFADTISIRLKKSPRLAQQFDSYRLMLQIDPQNQLEPMQYERSRAVIVLRKSPVKPVWWNNSVKSTLLGEFTAKKYSLFLQNVPGAETLDADLIRTAPHQAIALVKEYKRWLIANPTKDDDGTWIVDSLPL